MSFFSYFPRTVITNEGNPIVVEDFLSRVTISKEFRDNLVLLDDYFVQDGETPEMVSYKVYNTPLYHWIIFLVNDIIDPRDEWPIPDAKVTEFVFASYDFVVTVPDASKYNVDDVVNSDTGGEFIVTEVGATTVSLRSQKGITRLSTTSQLSNITTEENDLPVTSVIDPTEGIHHYYDTDIGYIVDNDISNPNIVAVTNYEYETNKNDEKRTIKILNERYISEIIRDFRNKIGE
jgi:hypothetical protein